MSNQIIQIIYNETLKITPKKVDYLVNTYWHGDYTGGNENMGKVGALIVFFKERFKAISRNAYQILSRVEAGIKKGKTLDEVKSNAEITKDYTSFGGWIMEERI